MNCMKRFCVAVVSAVFLRIAGAISMHPSVTLRVDAEEESEFARESTEAHANCAPHLNYLDRSDVEDSSDLERRDGVDRGGAEESSSFLENRSSLPLI